ncbi:hypothetical protein SK854_45770 [Lentzea sp. BCCO 10_0061]|uniref:TetR family transcriptional regulator n=1 Tax=Lentzea sokolovensis TaxID=3095429 RepID=A0ABU4VCJ9_9PSEU|nr:hypothetical protein [Lentzea sp. BCCO 10_0061]MDX8149500.1 hypothetical protein [Lentzea sp. BCCO 10_0061]
MSWWWQRAQLRAMLVHVMVEAASRMIALGCKEHGEVVIQALLDRVVHGLGQPVS